MDNLDKTNYNNFKKEIDSLSWKAFEDSVILLFQKIFDTINVKIIHTPYSHDGGKDGDGTLNIFPQYDINKSGLDFQVKIWIEVKKRSTKVGGHDVGIHALSAFLNKVSLIVFASNASFEPQVSEILQSLCNNHNINYYLVDGEKLFQLYQKYEKQGTIDFDENKVRHPLSAKISFSKRSLRQYSASVISVNLHEPFYVFIDFEAVSNTNAQEYELVSECIEFVPYKNVPSLAQSSALQCEKVTHIWIGLPKKEVQDGYVEIKFIETSSIIQKGVTIKKALFTLMPIGKIKENIKQLEASIDLWESNKIYQSCIIYGNAGTGKSFIINSVRTYWLRENISEILLDGEIENSEALLLNRLIQELFPIVNGVFKKEQKDVLYDFLSVHCQLPYTLAKKLADIICTKGFIDINEFSSELLADLLYFLLREKSSTEKLVIVYEDIHKCQPSVVRILLKIHKMLLNEHNENIFLILSSRKSTSFSQSDIIENWIYYMEQLLADQNIQSISIEPYTTDEAKFVIQQIIWGLNEIDVYNIVKQVGTTPFGIKEAMLYMYQKGWIYYDETIQNFVFKRKDYQFLTKSIKTNEFIQSTKYRLLELKNIVPLWCIFFLDAAACIGSSFPIQWCLKIIKQQIPEQEFVNTLSILNRLGILKISNIHHDYLRFDHDLIRLVILNNQGEIKFRELSHSLFGVVPDQPEFYKQKAFLAFQAALTEDAMYYAEMYADTSTQNCIYEDALEAYKMCARIIDYNLFSGLRQTNMSLWFVDDALNMAKDIQTAPNIEITQKNKKLLQLCLKIVEVATHIGSGCQEIVELFINEGLLLSKLLNNPTAEGIFNIKYGILLFDKKETKKSIAFFRKALEMLPRQETYYRGDALVELAISLRHCGLKEDSFKALKEALNQCNTNDYEIKLRVFANAGSLYYNIDWQHTKRYWERALRIAEYSNNVHFWTHILVDIGLLYLLENRFDVSERYYNVAYQKANFSGIRSQEFRIDMHRSILALINYNNDDVLTQLRYAELLIKQAEKLGVSYANERRLWRVYANWANLLEMKLKFLTLSCEDKISTLKLIYIYDKRAISEFKTTSIHDSSLIGVLTNAYIRMQQYRYSTKNFLSSYGSDIKNQVISLHSKLSENKMNSIPDNLTKFIKPLLGFNRFIFP